MVTRPRRLATCVALALSAVVSVTACGAGSSAAPRTLPPLVVSPTASAMPSSPATSTPAGSGKKAELAAATAVVRRYYGLFNAPTTYKTAHAIARLILPRCKCQEVVSSFVRAARSHERFVGKGHLTAVRPEYDSPSQVGALISFNSTRGGLVRANGEYIRRLHAQRDVTEHLDLRYVRGRWRIQRIFLISASH